MYICFVYVHPNKKKHEQPLGDLKYTLMSVPKSEYVLIMGDINAPVGNMGRVVDEPPIEGLDDIGLEFIDNANINLGPRIDLGGGRETYMAHYPHVA